MLARSTSENDDDDDDEMKSSSDEVETAAEHSEVTVRRGKTVLDASDSDDEEDIVENISLSDSDADDSD